PAPSARAAVAAPARRLDLQLRAGGERARPVPGERAPLGRARDAHAQAAGSSSPAAGEAPGTAALPIADEGRVTRAEEAQALAHAEPAAVAAATARSGAQLEGLEAHRVAELEGLDRSVARVRHVRLETARSKPVRARARAAG